MCVLGACSSVQIDDHEWCVIAGVDGAYCFHTLSEKTRDVSHAQWLIESRGWFAGSPDAYANLKEAIEKLCEETKQCKYEEIENFFTKIEKAQKKVKPIVPLGGP